MRVLSLASVVPILLLVAAGFNAQSTSSARQKTPNITERSQIKIDAGPDIATT
jgi:hypothetical protein